MDDDDNFIVIEILKDIQVTPNEDFQDPIMEDMRRFIFKTFDLGHAFYKRYTKVKRFEV